MQVNAVISAIVTVPPNTGKKINTTITYLRQSQKSQAPALGVALNALTTNTLDRVLVNEMNVTSKTEPTLTIGQWAGTTGGYYATITYNGDGKLYLECDAPAYISKVSDYYRLDVQTNGSFSGTIYATETETYAAKTLEFTRS